MELLSPFAIYGYQQQPLDNGKNEHDLGLVTADTLFSRLGVLMSSPSDDDSLPRNTVPDFTNCAFRVVSKLSYRAQADANEIQKKKDTSSLKKKSHITAESDGEEKGHEDLSLVEQEEHMNNQLRLAEERVESEKRQNRETMEKIRTGKGEYLKYGDIVQFQHLRSERYITMDHSPALINPICHNVTLGEGSPAAYFQIVPRFKVRALGSTVYRDDEVFVSSVTYDVLFCRTETASAIVH